MIGLIIPGELPTTNEIIDLSKKHYMQYSEMKSTYTGLVSMIARGLCLTHSPFKTNMNLEGLLVNVITIQGFIILKDMNQVDY